jgi:hypothetical protein
MGCIAAHGNFYGREGRPEIVSQPACGTAFLLELITRLQTAATVTMIDIHAYARFLSRG